MSRFMIFYIDYEDEIVNEIFLDLKKSFKDYTINIQYHNSNILDNIKSAINSDYKIPLILLGEKILDKFGTNIFYELKQNLTQTNLILLSKSKIFDISKNIKNLGFYNHISKDNFLENIYVHVNDAIKNYHMNLQIENSYKRDNLTGLYNRNTLLKDIEKYKTVSLLLINIDDFRTINATYGYTIGDEILKRLAHELSSRFQHVVYRLISDEFVILLDNTNKSDIYDVATKIKKCIQKKDFIINDEVINITVTIAISLASKNLIEDAQKAIQNSMRCSKNNICYIQEDVEVLDEFNIAKLRLAFAKDTVVPFYQGIRNNKTKEIDRYECLVRLRDENDKLISPNKFLDLAQNMGLISKITKIMIRKSFKYFSSHNGRFSINLTEDDLKEQYLIDFIKEQSMEHNIDLHRLTFEILENINVENSSLIFKQIKEIKKLGCKIAFDDFGCEKSNFSRLLDLNIDVVKIDSMFIKNLNKDSKSFKLTKAITSLAKDFNCEVIAEGVESKEVQDIIEELDIDFTQGYYFSKPEEKP